jgi:hypothetical protein
VPQWGRQNACCPIGRPDCPLRQQRVPRLPSHESLFATSDPRGVTIRRALLGLVAGVIALLIGILPATAAAGLPAAVPPAAPRLEPLELAPYWLGLVRKLELERQHANLLQSQPGPS